MVLSHVLATLFAYGTLPLGGFAHLFRYSHAFWLRSGLMVLSQRLASLVVNGTLPSIGYAPLLWYSRSALATLCLSGTLTRCGYAQREWYSLRGWLRSQGMVLSPCLAPLCDHGTLYIVGSALWQCGTLSSYGYAP